MQLITKSGLCFAGYILLLAQAARGQTPLGTEFTYQGQLSGSGTPAIGNADFRYALFDAPQGGAQIGTTIARDNVALVNGLFTLPLDFGAPAFNGDARWIEVALRSPAGSGGFTTLAPRQPVTATPYATQTRGLFVDSNKNVGIGTASPNARLHVLGDVPALRLQDDGDPSSFLQLEHNQPGQMSLNNVASTGISLLDLNPMSSNGTQNAHIRIFRHTNTTGLKSIIFHTGNDTNAQSAAIGVGGSTSFFQLDGGNFGIGTASPQAKLDVNGTARVKVLEITGADLAEKFPTSEKLEPGMVVAIDKLNPGKLCLAREAYNRCVAGVVSGANSFSVGAVLGSAPESKDAPAIALSGRVYVYCDASIAAIEPGDLLTTSDIEGRAMKVTDFPRAQGAIIGKAMTALNRGQLGMVLVLVSLQ